MDPQGPKEYSERPLGVPVLSSSGRTDTISISAIQSGSPLSADDQVILAVAVICR